MSPPFAAPDHHRVVFVQQDLLKALDDRFLRPLEFTVRVRIEGDQVNLGLHLTEKDGQTARICFDCR